MLLTEIAILLLLLVACLSAVTFKFFKFPYTVGLVIIGFGLGSLEQFGIAPASLKDFVLSPDLILFIFIPPLIFETAINLDNRLLQRNLTPILVLAIPGLVLSMFLVGGLLAWLTPLSLVSAMLFGALISATDPVAVIALFKESGVGKRLTILVEGESMLNDATAIVAFELVLFIATSGALEATTASEVVVRVAIVLVGGAAVGWLMGALLGYALVLAQDDAMIQVTVSVIGAYMAFILAEHYLHVSGVVAVMVAGLVLARNKSRRLSPKRRFFFQGSWEYVAFLANSLIFLLVGISTAGFIDGLLTTNPEGLWLTVIAGIVVVLIARGVVVFSLIPPLNRFLKDGPISWRYQTIIYWGGLRGAVALALVLSLDTDFAGRDLLIAMTLGVALFTIVVCGTSIGNLIRRLKLDEPTIIDRLAEAEALYLAQHEKVAMIEELRGKEAMQQWILDEVKGHYQVKLRQAEEALRSFWAELRTQPDLNRRALWLQALALEQKGYQEAFDQRLISEDSLVRLQLLLDLKREAVLAGHSPPPLLEYEALGTHWEKILPGFADSAASPTGELLKEVLRQPADDWLQEQQASQALKGEFEYDMAVLEVTEQVARQISELAAQQVVDTAIAEECSQAYRQIMSQTLARLQTIIIQSPNLAQDLQRRIIHRSAIHRAQTRLEKLKAQGIISSAVGERARGRIEAE